MKDTDVASLIAGGGVTGGGLGLGWWRRRKAKKEAKAWEIARRLFPRSDPQKLDREVANILRHRKAK